MSLHQIIGVVLILTALVDLMVGFGLVGKRIANPDSRRLVMLALVAGAGVLGGLGVAFLVGAL